MTDTNGRCGCRAYDPVHNHHTEAAHPAPAEPALAAIMGRCPKCNGALYRCEYAGCSALAQCGEAWCAAHTPEGAPAEPVEEDTRG